ncbi:hypothetical protein EC08BKT77219_3210 [Escherichia coli 08BKT77219]|nr:hypothetical protein EC08BKT77219_3210 [Escherichia coli 08BKT77219]
MWVGGWLCWRLWRSGKLTGARGGKAGVVGNDRSGHPQ